MYFYILYFTFGLIRVSGEDEQRECSMKVRQEMASDLSNPAFISSHISLKDTSLS